MPNKSQSTRRTPKSKSKVVADNRKPYPEFPLTPHPTGRWCKKVRSKLWYFCAFDDGWEAALARYKNEIDDIQAGRTPRARNKHGVRLRDLCNHFLHAKRQRVEEGTLTLHCWYDYHR